MFDVLKKLRNGVTGISKTQALDPNGSNPEDRKHIHDGINAVGKTREVWRKEYPDENILRKAGDTKAVANLKLCADIQLAIQSGIEKGKFGNVRHFPCVKVEAEEYATLRNTEWKSNAKRKTLLVRNMDWTHLVNTFGMFFRALRAAYAKKNSLPVGQVQDADPGLLLSLIQNPTMQGLVYEIEWRLQFGRKLDPKLCWSHEQVRQRKEIDGDDFFFSFKEPE